MTTEIGMKASKTKARRTGQIIERGANKWLVRVFIGRDDATGKRNYFNDTIHGTKKDAQRFLNGVLREIDLGTFVAPSSMSVGQYLDKWLEAAAKPRVSERTHYDYTALLERYVREPIGNLKLSGLRPLDIQKLYSQMQERGLSPRVVRYTHAVLSNALKQAVKWGMLSRNPADLVELPKQTRQEMKAFTPEEAARFLQAAAEDRHGVLFAFALATGMRPEEYLALRWSDVNLQAGTATVQRALVWRSGGGYYFTEPKTARSRRTISLPSSLVRKLFEHRQRQLEERMRLGPEWQNLDLIFCTIMGTPLSVQNLSQRHFKAVLKAAGLSSDFRLYDLRHSAATMLLFAGENPKVVSEQLGHASIVLTLDTYSHVLPSMQKAAAEKLENLLFSNVGTL
jgi:integrase